VYHAVDKIDLEYELKDGVKDSILNSGAQKETFELLLQNKKFEAAEELMHMTFKWIRIPGVVTYLPTDADVKQAYGSG
jgi:hypothetical protein